MVSPLVTEDEIAHGIFKLQNPQDHCLCYIRELEGLDNQLSDKAAKQYIDISTEDPTKADTKSQQLLDNLKNVKVPTYLGSKNVRTYSLPWMTGGVNPQNIGESSCSSRGQSTVFCDPQQQQH